MQLKGQSEMCMRYPADAGLKKHKTSVKAQANLQSSIIQATPRRQRVKRSFELAAGKQTEGMEFSC